MTVELEQVLPSRALPNPANGAIDLFRPFMSPLVTEYLSRVVTPDESGRVYCGEGPRVQEFEQAFGELVGAAQPILALNSCTSALDLALHLAGIGLGDEVISTPLTCTATNGVIVNRKAKLVWADCDPITGLIDPADVARKITRRTKAIMAVDWAGRSCDYRSLRRAARAAPWLTIPIIQDAAHNLMIDMGNHGDYVCWSFQAIKHLTTGDGGALLCPSEQYDRARLLRWYGLDRLSSSDFRCAQTIIEAGFKYHMNDIAASIGLANIPHAAWYSERLQDVSGVTLPPEDPRASWWLYTVLVDDRDRFTAHLKERDIATSPVHARNDRHPAFSFPNGPLPGVDSFDAHQTAIPVGWWLSDTDREQVADAVLSYSPALVKILSVA